LKPSTNSVAVDLRVTCACPSRCPGAVSALLLSPSSLLSSLFSPLSSLLSLCFLSPLSSLLSPLAHARAARQSGVCRQKAEGGGQRAEDDLADEGVNSPYEGDGGDVGPEARVGGAHVGDDGKVGGGVEGLEQHALPPPCRQSRPAPRHGGRACFQLHACGRLCEREPSARSGGSRWCGAGGRGGRGGARP
jgi:hypothetical protein